MRKLLKIFYGIPTRRIVGDLFFSCLWSCFNCWYVVMLANLTEKALNDIQTLPCLAFLYIAYFSVWEFVEFVGDIYSEVSKTYLENNINRIYFNKLYYIKPEILKKHNTGFISGLIKNLIRDQEAAYEHTVLYLPISLFYIVFFSIKAWSYHWVLGLTMLLLISVAVSVQVLGGNPIVKLAKLLTGAEATRDKIVIDSVINMGTVQKMQALDFINKKLDTQTDDCHVKTKKYAITNELFFCGFKYMVFLYVPICLFLFYGVASKTNFDVAGFFAILSLIGIQLVHMSKSIGQTIKRWLQFIGTSEKINTIVSENNKRQNLYTSEFHNATIKDLDYVYRTNQGDEDSVVRIKIPHFHIDKGDIVCIYGESGQGKTTLLNVLSGEIETQNVLINNKQTNERLDCVFISQDTEILDMTLRDNLTLGNDTIPDTTILEYLEAVGLIDWFNKQKNGLDTLLGERGVFVSTGQRQRLNLVRGLLIKDKEIYLLDEPTSNVDEETEVKMVELIKHVLKDKTVIIVTHRPKILEICNHHYEFKDGVFVKVQ